MNMEIKDDIVEQVQRPSHETESVEHLMRGSDSGTGAVDPVSKAIEKLFRSIRTTTGARFLAERRLRWHDRFTQTTLMLHSIALIALPVGRMAGLDSYLRPQIANASEVLLAVFVLALGLLLGQGNFAARAEGMNRCARRLLRLERHLELVRHRQSTEDEYIAFTDKYAAVLDASEAHRPLDFFLVRLQHKDYHYKNRPVAYVRDLVLARLRIAVEYGLYFISLMLPLIMVASLLPPK